MRIPRSAPGGEATRNQGTAATRPPYIERSSSAYLAVGLELVIIGLVLGALGAVGLGTVISRLLYGVSPLDPPSLAGAAAVLLSVAMVACYLPARRASRLDPLTVLRSN